VRSQSFERRIADPERPPERLAVNREEVVQEKREVVRLGEAQPRKCDVRFVAATWRDLQAEVQAKRFREDLYFRLNVVNIKLPPLRDRLDDLPLLLDHFLLVHGKSLGRTLRMSAPALERLRAHRWPGNIRELGSVSQKLAIYASADEITADDVTSSMSS